MPVSDFDVTAGSNGPWESMPVVEIPERGVRKSGYRTQCRFGYSQAGLYVQFQCEDRRLTCQEREDFDDIFKDDVAELFFQPDPGHPFYLEHEISPLGKELVLMVGNQNGQFMGWRPWHYEGDRVVRKKVTVSGGEQKAGATVASWRADLFIPFTLFKGLARLPVSPGTLWRGNACRMDFDESPRAKWTLFPQTNGEFHRFEEFGTFRFE